MITAAWTGLRRSTPSEVAPITGSITVGQRTPRHVAVFSWLDDCFFRLEV
jgi:hypothetical protein